MPEQPGPPVSQSTKGSLEGSLRDSNILLGSGPSGGRAGRRLGVGTGAGNQRFSAPVEIMIVSFVRLVEDVVAG